MEMYCPKVPLYLKGQISTPITWSNGPEQFWDDLPLMEDLKGEPSMVLNLGIYCQEWLYWQWNRSSGLELSTTLYFVNSEEKE